VCGAKSPAGQKFCGNCGEPLQADAAQPSPATPDSFTPRHLAQRILTSRSALEGERKHVTVLFADIKGSLELIESYDAEVAHRFLSLALAVMMRAVHRYEGTVNKVLGDGIMALFGAPIANEDHAVRACYAALAMQQELRKLSEQTRIEFGAEPQLRVGINSGEVVFRAIGNETTSRLITTPSGRPRIWQAAWSSWRCPAQCASPSIRTVSRRGLSRSNLWAAYRSRGWTRRSKFSS
jgi:class 3 adenylate cyclase